MLLVIANHLWSQPWAGFFGVDVFFVISGFLITGLLVRERDSTGRIAVRRFYLRRFKRLAPAALVTTGVTLAAAVPLFAHARLQQAGTDALAGSFAVANWRFAWLGTDYMHRSDAPSPFLHFWSLSVEEQFYLFWPMLIIVVGSVAAGRLRRRPLLVAVGVVIVVSFAWSVWQTMTDSTTAYFATPARGWELAAGGAVAVAANRFRQLPPQTAALLSWGGAAGVAASVLLTGPSVPVPAPGALLVVLSTAAILAGGVRSPLRLLAMRPLVAVGTRSYSLYLWHYPVIVLLAQIFPQRATKFTLAVLALTALLGTASFHLVEDPLRRAQWCQALRRPAISPFQHLSRPATLRLIALPVTALVLALGCFALRQPPDLRSFPAGSITRFGSLAGLERGRVGDVTAALAARSWPRLTPSPERARANRAPQWIHDGCLGNDVGSLPDPVRNAQRCVFGDPHGNRRMILIGDSTAISYLPGLLDALPPTWRVEVWTMSQCSAADAPTARSDGTLYPACDAFRKETFAHIRATRPDLVVSANVETASSQMASGNDGAGVIPRWTAAEERTLRAVAPFARRVVLLDPPPATLDIGTCRTPLASPRDCEAGLDAHYVWTVTAQRAAVARLALPNVSYPQTLSWFCDDRGYCPSFVGTTLIRADNGHLTVQAARQLAPLLRSVLASSVHLSQPGAPR